MLRAIVAPEISSSPEEVRLPSTLSVCAVMRGFSLFMVESLHRVHAGSSCLWNQRQVQRSKTGEIGQILMPFWTRIALNQLSCCGIIGLRPAPPGLLMLSYTREGSLFVDNPQRRLGLDMA